MAAPSSCGVVRVPLPMVHLVDRFHRLRKGWAIYQPSAEPVEITLDLAGLGLFAHFNVIAGLAMRLRNRGRRFRIRCITANYAAADHPEWLGGLVQDLAPLDPGEQACPVLIPKHAQVPNKWAGEVLTLEGARDGFFGKFAFDPRWVAHAEAFAARRFEHGKTLGLHYRGTDKRSEAPRVDYETVLGRVRARLAGGAFSRLFVATDETELVAFLTARVGVPVIVQTDVIRSESGTAVHLRADRAQGFKKAVDALTDCLLLARCDHLLKTASALSGWSALVNPALSIEFLNTPHTNGRFFPDSALLVRTGTGASPASTAIPPAT